MDVPKNKYNLGEVYNLSIARGTLTAADRPYKAPKTLSESIKIMGFVEKDRHIDGDLFRLFLKPGVFRDYAERSLRPEQIDEVYLSRYLGAPPAPGPV